MSKILKKQKVFVKHREGYPYNPSTVGEHIKKRRMDLGLFQKNIAKLWNVTEETITNWENGYSSPQIKYYPLIAQFLGYVWWQFDTTTLSGKLKDYRYRNGLSAKCLGYIVNIDSSTVCSWEQKRCMPNIETLKIIEKQIL